MKTFSNLLKQSLYVFCAIVAASCSSEQVCDQPQPAFLEGQPKTCNLILDIDKPAYADDASTRSASTWSDGDKIYLTFTTKSGKTYGDAIYKSGSWTVNYYGSLTQGTETECSAVYFENPKYASGSVVQADEHTAIYEDSSAVYAYNGSTLAVTANLTPKTGRIRFEGADKETITVYGIRRYTSYDVSNGRYTTSIGAITTSVSTQYTPYIYGAFSDSDEPRLNIITKNSGYTRILPKNIYQPGQSGYMTIPTETSHNGWQNSVILKVNNVEFTMIPVEYSKGFFLLAETETTEQLYNAITGGTATTSTYPQTSMSYSTCSSFISKMKAITELNFYIPSTEEWQHAYKGGVKTQGYTYSGSNIISNVGWYSGNSGGKKQKVKQLQPNELGFYDMCGNVAELTNNANEYYYGGAYSTSESNCRASYYSSYSSYYTGLRFALKP